MRRRRCDHVISPQRFVALRSLLATVFAALVIFLPSPAVHHLHPLLFLLPCLGIDLAVRKLLLALEFALALQPILIESALRHGRLHRASWLRGVPPIAVSALRC